MMCRFNFKITDKKSEYTDGSDDEVAEYDAGLDNKKIMQIIFRQLVLSVLFCVNILPVHSEVDTYTQTLTIDNIKNSELETSEVKSYYNNTIYQSENKSEEKKQEPVKNVYIDNSIFSQRNNPYLYNNNTTYKVIVPVNSRNFDFNRYSYSYRGYGMGDGLQRPGYYYDEYGKKHIITPPRHLSPQVPENSDAASVPSKPNSAGLNATIKYF